MDYRDFKDSVFYEIEKAEREMNEDSVLDLRVSRYPYKTNIDNALFCIADIYDAWEFVKGAREWYVDVFENIYENGKSMGAEYTGCSVIDEGDSLLKRIDSCNLYNLRWVNGERYIHILGYYYDAGCSVEEDEDKTWRCVEFCGLELPLDEYISMTSDEQNLLESECKQYIGDLTREEVLDCFSGENAPCALYYGDVTEDTPDDKIYIASL